MCIAISNKSEQIKKDNKEEQHKNKIGQFTKREREREESMTNNFPVGT